METSCSGSASCSGSPSNLEQTNENNSKNVKNLKHFKKAFIVEYERIESNTGGVDDSQSSVSSVSSTASSSTSTKSSSSSSSNSNLTSFANSSISILNKKSALSSITHETVALEKNIFKRKLDLYEDEASSTSLTNTPTRNANDYDEEDDDNSDTRADFIMFDKHSVSASINKRKKNDNIDHEASSGSKSASINKKLNKKESEKEKENEKENKNKKKIYCICKSADTKRFMIACDNCDDWFHGDCVGVTQSLSKKIKAFYCHLCRSDKPSLKIKYKSKYNDFSKNLNKQRAQELSSTDSTFLKFYKETQARLKKEAELLKKPEKSNQNKHVSKTESKSTSTIPSLYQKSIKTEEDFANNESLEKEEEIESDTNNQQATSKYYGKTKVSGEDIENFVSAITQLNDTAHRESLEMQQKFVVPNSNTELNSDTVITNGSSSSSSSCAMHTKTDHDYTSRTSDFDNPASVDRQSTLNEHEQDNFDLMETDSGDEEDDEESASDFSSANDTSDENSQFTDENDSIPASRKSRFKSDDSSSKKSSTTSKKSVTKTKLNLITKDEKIVLKKSAKTSKISTSTKIKKEKISKITSNSQKPKARKTDKDQLTITANLSSRPRRLRQNSENDLCKLVDKNSLKKEAPPTQCLGPDCVNQSVQNSKYCSHECGMKLAKNRLISYLKTRYDQYSQHECLSDKINLNELERINFEFDLMRRKLTELEQKHLDLDKIIERAKYAKINPNVEKDREKFMDSNETEIYCVSCGQVCSEKHAMKHMEKCFNKIESQAFFGSFYKTHTEGQSMFCDYFNAQTKMYCKRLKVMCPEHEKEKKISDEEVCGHPLPNPANVMEDSEHEICLAPKRTCSIHHKWEKLRRAQIDLEKLRTWIKLEELVEQKRMNEASLNQRKGLLSILLHQSIIHDSEGQNNDEGGVGILNNEYSLNNESGCQLSVTNDTQVRA